LAREPAGNLIVMCQVGARLRVDLVGGVC